MRFFLKLIIVCGALIACIYSLSYFSSHYRSINLDDLTGTPDSDKEWYFSQTPLLRQQIEEYFRNSTILISDPPIGNDITYYGYNGIYINWHGTELSRRHWTIFPVLYQRIYKGKSRIDITYTMCTESTDGTFGEGCKLMVSKKDFYRFKTGIVEHYEGDLLGLSTRNNVPFNLPSSAITMTQIQDELFHR